MESKTTAIARINNVDILIIENGEKRVAIKPICDALGIDAKSQRDVLQNHPIYGSTGGMITSVGADGKQREMFTIPLEFVFGWLLNIDSRKVNEANCQIKEFTGYIKDSIILLTLSDLGGNVKSEQKRKDTIEYLAQSINLIEQLSAPINNRRTNRKDTDD